MLVNASGKSLRWRIALLIGAAIAISYFDRQTLSVAISAIQREIPISNTQFSQLQACFLIAYAVMYAGGGKLIDSLGTRTGFTLIMIWWSLASASHGLARSFGMLAGSRVLLGAGEGGGFPAATKAISEWFPTRERATAMGIVNAGTAIGAVIAPPAIALIIAGLNWRWVFFFSGTIGASAALMPWILFITHVPVHWAIVLFSLAFFGQQSWSTLVMILPADLFPHRVVGSVAGLVGFGGAMGGAVFGLVAGYLLDHGFGYGPVFLAVSTFHLAAFFIILLCVRNVAPMRVEALKGTL